MNDHTPTFLENPDSKSLAVFIHGFMGSPRQFDYLAEAAHAYGCSAASLLLPGHGGTVKEFSKSTMENWQNHVDSEVGRLSHDFDDVLLVGHSMGGLLAINTAAKYTGNVRGLLLIACPFKLSIFSGYSIKVLLKQAFSRKSRPIKAAYIAGSSVSPSPSLIWRVSKPTAELKKLISAAKENLSEVRAPVTAIYSTADETVSIESLETLQTRLDRELLKQIILSDSLHAYFPEHEQEIIKNALVQIIASSAREARG